MLPPSAVPTVAAAALEDAAQHRVFVPPPDMLTLSPSVAATAAASAAPAFVLLTVPATIAFVVGLAFLARLASWRSSPRSQSYAPIPVADDGDSDATTATAAAPDLEATESSPLSQTASGPEGSGSVAKLGTVDVILRYAAAVISVGTLGLSVALLPVATSRDDLIILVINVASQAIMLACFAFVALLSNQPTAPSFLIGSVIYTAGLTFCSAAMANDANAPARHLISWSAVLGAVILACNLGRHYVQFLVRGTAAAFHGSAQITPEVTASLMSLLTFSWMSSIISKGNQTPLTMDALWQLRETDTAKEAFGRFRKYRKPGKSLAFTLAQVVIIPLLIQYSAALVGSFLVYGGPFFLNLILQWLQNPEGGYIVGWGLLLCMLATNFASAMANGQQYFHGRRIGAQVASSLLMAMYGKALRRPISVSSSKQASSEATGDDDKTAEKKEDSKSEEESGAGSIVTMMTVDADRVVVFVCYSMDPLLNIPLQVILALAGLFAVLGWSSIIGIVIILLNGPITGYLGSFMEAIQDKQMKANDKRVSITTEVMNGIRIIKYFGWEEQFAAKIMKVRDEELGFMLRGSILWILTSVITYFNAVLCFFATFATYTIIAGNKLDAATAFTSVILLTRVADLFVQGPFLYLWLVKTKVSLDRISKFINGVELDEADFSGSVSDGTSVGISKGHFRYHTHADGSTSPTVSETNSDSDDQGMFFLRDLNVSFKIGGLNVISGATGSGKSSLVLALLGELKKLSGSVHFPADRSNVAYVAQTAWLLNATIRDNILMGAKMDEQKYKQVLEDCALVRDLETLESGDLTEIGEKGISLSGGQKQRVSLARAVYSDTSIVLLDDPLSAVDAPTARHLMKDAIQKAMSGRTVILITHALGLAVRAADHIVMLKNGEVLAQGTPEEVASNEEVTAINDSHVGASVESSHDGDGVDEKKAVMTDAANAKKLIKDEEKETGSVKWSVYMTYFVAAGAISIAFAGLFFVLDNILKVAADAWVANWTEAMRNQTESVTGLGLSSESKQSGLLWPFATGIPGAVPSNVMTRLFVFYRGDDDAAVTAYWKDNSEVLFYVAVYGLIGVVQVINRAVLSTLTAFASLRASRIIHQRLAKSVLGSPLRFFETTPIGRILNRFTKDMNNVDESVNQNMYLFMSTATHAVTIVIVISFFSPLFVLALLPIGFVYRSITILYLNASRELKRLESLSVSPVISNFSESLNGASTIRAYGLTDKFLEKNERLVDAKNRCFYHLWASNRWLNLRTDFISALFIFCAGVVVLSTDISPGWAGITILYATQFSDALLWLVRSQAEMEMSLNAVERCNEYSVLEQEPARVVDDYRPGAEWPEGGVVEVKDLSIRYAPDQPLVLKNITFTTNKGEKIGVVGRTGAGKSTLSLAFFRIVPHANGTIIIDGMDINRMGLQDLRSRLTIIPQDPVLFTGTVRSNLDPLSEWNDEDLWRVLRSTHVLESLQSTSTSTSTSTAAATAAEAPAEAPAPLEATLSSTTLVEEVEAVASSSSSSTGSGEATTVAGSKAFSLDTAVQENGSNFSQGQRQLLCLARALLRRSRVIFLDEATASIDAATDERIQETIKHELGGATVFCIAHRLRTVADFDRVLVLSQGEVAEFGAPAELMERPGGLFRRMCEDSGEIEELRRIARRTSTAAATASDAATIA
ncbi:hypothetical protein HK405_011074 [Cladochytrium tenue]|nr:hypothetical protein HK405_011074 [Cladochytrium tenue]